MLLQNYLKVCPDFNYSPVNYALILIAHFFPSRATVRFLSRFEVLAMTFKGKTTLKFQIKTLLVR
jgi:hypothetical protein